MLAVQSLLPAVGLLLLLSRGRVRAEEVTCYAPDGVTIADNETYVPCNKLGITQTGIHSSCCRLDGDQDARDICSTSGLCTNQITNLLTRGYCTDKTWASAACVNVCTDPDEGGNKTGIARLTNCADGTGKYSCGSDTSHCGTDLAVAVASQASVVDSSQIASANASLQTFRSATIALAAICGVLALVLLASVLWLLKKNKSLKREVATAESAGPTVQDQQPQQSQLLPSPSLHGETGGQSPPSQYANQFHKQSYNTLHGSPNPSEAVPAYPGHNIQRYSELDGAAVARSEMGSPEPFERERSPGVVRSQ